MASPAAIPDAPPRSRWDGVRMSLGDFEALPEEKPYLEYFGGRVVQKAVPKRPHGKGQLRFGRRLEDFAERYGGDAWTEPTIYFDFLREPGYLVPDVAYWAPGKPQGDDDRSLPPTLAVEIRSKDQALSVLFAKCRLMRANGVDVCWLIDPVAQNAYVFEGDHDGEPVGRAGILASPFLPSFEFRLDELWAAIG